MSLHKAIQEYRIYPEIQVTAYDVQHIYPDPVIECRADIEQIDQVHQYLIEEQADSLHRK